MIELSVIIPIFNGEKYIRRCLNSILETKDIKYEIIIVDNNSYDNTKYILNEYLKYKHIHVYVCKTQGVSYARNMGLKYAKGKYIGFVDIDDYVDKNMFNFLVKTALKYNLDICGCNYYEIFNDLKIKSKYNYNNKVLKSKEAFNQFLSSNISPVLWDKIYKKDIIKDIRFNEKIKFNEDVIFNIEAFYKSKMVKLINKYYYYYYQNNNSLIHNYNCIDIINNDYSKFIKNKVNKEFLCHYELKKLHSLSQAKDKKNRYIYLKKYIDKAKLKELLNYDIKFYSKFEIFVFLANIRLHLFMFNLYKFIRNNRFRKW